MNPGPESLPVFGRFGLFPDHPGRLRLQKARLDRAGLAGEVWFRDCPRPAALEPFLPARGVGAFHLSCPTGAWEKGPSPLAANEEGLPPLLVFPAAALQEERFLKRFLGREILLGPAGGKRVYLEWDGSLPVETFLEFLVPGRGGRGPGVALDLGAALRILTEEEYRLLGGGDLYLPKQRGWMLEGERDLLGRAAAAATVRLLEACRALLREGPRPVHLAVHGWHPMAPRFSTDHLPLGVEISYRVGEALVVEGEFLGEHAMGEVLELCSRRAGPGRITVGIASTPVRWTRELLGGWRELFPSGELQGGGLREAEILMAFLSGLEESARIVREALRKRMEAPGRGEGDPSPAGFPSGPAPKRPGPEGGSLSGRC